MNRQRHNSRPTATNQVFGMSQNRMPRNSIVYHHLSPLECPKTGLDIHLQTNPNDGNPNLSYLHAHVLDGKNMSKPSFDAWLFPFFFRCWASPPVVLFSDFTKVKGLFGRLASRSRGVPLHGGFPKDTPSIGGNEINFGTIRHPPSWAIWAQVNGSK